MRWTDPGRAGLKRWTRKGPLSIVLGGLIFLGAAVGWWRTAAEGTGPRAAVVLLEARPAGGRFGLSVSWWTANGRRLRQVSLGNAVGMLAPWESLAVWRRSAVVAAVDRLVTVAAGGRVRSWPSPDGAVLEVFAARGRLWVLTARRGGSSRLWRFDGRFRPVAAVPAGLVRFVPGDRHPWILLVRPRDTRLWWPGLRPVTIAAPAEGQATAAVGSRTWVPVLVGDRPGLWMGSGDRGHIAVEGFERGVLAVSATRPAWGFGVQGAVPLGASGPRWGALRAWPGPLAGPVTPVGTGPRVLVMDGPARGFWFDPRTGRFGGAFRAAWTGPAIPVAAQLWPR